MQVNNPFIDKRLAVGWISEISGWGVFANEHIPANTIIERGSLIIFPTNIIHMAFWMLQAEGVKSTDFMLDRYLINWGSDHAAVPLGWCGLYNHSDRNNTTFQANIESKCIEIRTLRDILPNEQCTVHYGNEWFSAKGYVTKIDF